MRLLTYLNYGGDCEEAFRFYEQHLGGKITMMMTQGEVPGAKDLPPERARKIVHARMTIGGTELLASDVPPEVNFQPMGQIFMPMEETFFAHRFGMLRDRFGTSWMILHEQAQS
jgi:PhnB protein